MAYRWQEQTEPGQYVASNICPGTAWITPPGPYWPGRGGYLIAASTLSHTFVRSALAGRRPCGGSGGKNHQKFHMRSASTFTESSSVALRLVVVGEKIGCVQNSVTPTVKLSRRL